MLASCFVGNKGTLNWYFIHLIKHKCITTKFFKINHMEKDFFTSKEATQLTGCTLRQLQYWRDKEIVVPTISATGTGRSIYYSYSELVELAIMEYWLAMGFSFQTASLILEQLRAEQWDYLNPETTEQLMVHWKRDFADLQLEPFDNERASTLLRQGMLVVPFSFKQIHHGIKKNLNKNWNPPASLNEAVKQQLTVAGWNTQPHDYLEKYCLIEVNNQRKRRKKNQLIDYLLLYQSEFPIAVVEAKRKYRNPANGIEPAINKANKLGVQFAYSSNGKSVVEYDLKTDQQSNEMDNFPTPKELWHRLTVGRDTSQLSNRNWLTSSSPVREQLLYHYQKTAVQSALIRILQKEKRLLLSLVTGSGKTRVALQICWYLFQIKWNLKEEKRPPRILFVFPRQIAVIHAISQARNQFPTETITQIQGKAIKGDNIFFATTYDLKHDSSLPNLYQAYNPDYFDLIIFDQFDASSELVHQSKSEQWREIGEYFAPAYQLGFAIASTSHDLGKARNYFGDLVYQYSLEQGIADGVIAPYQIYRVQARSDLQQWQAIQKGLFPSLIPPEVYQTPQWEQKLVSESRTTAIAQHITQFLQKQDNQGKTVVICVDEAHVNKIVEKLRYSNRQLLSHNPDYIVPLIYSHQENLVRFQNLEHTTPVIGVAPKTMLTGVNLNCQNLFLACAMSSPTNLVQKMGRANHESKLSETSSLNKIVDYTNSTTLLEENNFNGELIMSGISEIND